jgi:GR25 family glycosyltransferase involved in LPS biosynthesis
MKGYVITLLNIPQSVEVAKRCMESAKKYGIDVEIFPAVFRDIAKAEAEKENLKYNIRNASMSKPDAVAGNFISQYRIWKKIRDSKEPAIVLEHDAVFYDKLPKIDGDIVNLGHPSFSKFEKKNKPGIYPLFSKKKGHFPGAHAYFVSPKGADLLIKKADEIGIVECDLFLNLKNFPNLKEIYPWIAKAKDTFSTIQNPSGCKPKHSFNKDYKQI